MTNRSIPPDPPGRSDLAEPSDPPEGARRIIVAGASLVTLRKRVRPALRAMKRFDGNASLTTTPTRVVMVLPGVAVGVPALTSGEFSFSMPWKHLKAVLDEPRGEGSLVVFELGEDALTIHDITTRSPEIVVRPPAVSVPSPSPADGSPADASPGGASSSGPAPAPARAAPQVPFASTPFDAPLGYPLLAAYAHLRRFGVIAALAEAHFAGAVAAVDWRLTKSGKLLKPLGLSRADLEQLPDHRLGLPPQ